MDVCTLSLEGYVYTFRRHFTSYCQAPEPCQSHQCFKVDGDCACRCSAVQLSVPGEGNPSWHRQDFRDQGSRFYEPSIPAVPGWRKYSLLRASIKHTRTTEYAHCFSLSPPRSDSSISQQPGFPEH